MKKELKDQSTLGKNREDSSGSNILAAGIIVFIIIVLPPLFGEVGTYFAGEKKSESTVTVSDSTPRQQVATPNKSEPSPSSSSVAGESSQPSQPSSGVGSPQKKTPAVIPTQPTPSQPIQPYQPPPPAVLAGCFFQNGAPAGKPCPASPPPSYSGGWPCSNSGTYVPCPPYSSVSSIWGEITSNNAPVCAFSYRESAAIRRARVLGYNQIPDCSSTGALGYMGY